MTPIRELAHGTTTSCYVICKTTSPIALSVTTQGAVPILWHSMYASDPRAAILVVMIETPLSGVGGIARSSVGDWRQRVEVEFVAAPTSCNRLLGSSPRGSGFAAAHHARIPADLLEQDATGRACFNSWRQLYHLFMLPVARLRCCCRSPPRRAHEACLSFMRRCPWTAKRNGFQRVKIEFVSTPSASQCLLCGTPCRSCLAPAHHDGSSRDNSSQAASSPSFFLKETSLKIPCMREAVSGDSMRTTSGLRPATHTSREPSGEKKACLTRLSCCESFCRPK